jgi:hypothetical protein
MASRKTWQELTVLPDNRKTGAERCFFAQPLFFSIISSTCSEGKNPFFFSVVTVVSVVVNFWFGTKSEPILF